MNRRNRFKTAAAAAVPRPPPRFEVASKPPLTRPVPAYTDMSFCWVVKLPSPPELLLGCQVAVDICLHAPLWPASPAIKTTGVPSRPLSLASRLRPVAGCSCQTKQLWPCAKSSVPLHRCYGSTPLLHRAVVESAPATIRVVVPVASAHIGTCAGVYVQERREYYYVAYYRRS